MIETFVFRKHNYGLEKQVLEANTEARIAGKKQAVFYITKPIQYINAHATGGIREENFNILILHGVFVGSDIFFQYIKAKSCIWDKIIFVDSLLDMYIIANALFLFDNMVEYWTTTDSGVVMGVLQRTLYKKGTKICLIEEGCGNYVLLKWNSVSAFAPVSLLKKIRQPLFEILNFLLGAGKSLGCCRWTDVVYLYYPDYPFLPCRGKNVRPMIRSACEQFKEMSFLFPLNDLPIVRENFVDKKILIIATEWNIYYRIEEEDFTKYDVVILKLHPHIREKFSPEDKRIHVLQTFIPTEVLVLHWLENNEVTLRSKFSSSMLYLHDSKAKLEFESGVPEFMKNIVDYVYSC